MPFSSPFDLYVCCHAQFVSGVKRSRHSVLRKSQASACTTGSVHRLQLVESEKKDHCDLVAAMTNILSARKINGNLEVCLGTAMRHATSCKCTRTISAENLVHMRFGLAKGGISRRVNGDQSLDLRLRTKTFQEMCKTGKKSATQPATRFKERRSMGFAFVSLA